MRLGLQPALLSLLAALLPSSLVVFHVRAVDVAGGEGECLLQKGHVKTRMGEPVDRAMPESDELPAHLRELGIRLFGGEDVLNTITNTYSTMAHITYEGVQIQLRAMTDDPAVEELHKEGGAPGYPSYGIDTLQAMKAKKKGSMITMLDIGANYGVVTIATFKRYPKQMQIVAVEPEPITYFFLRWNLWLNGVPFIEKSALEPGNTTAGVLALNLGLAGERGRSLQLCFRPPLALNTFVCSCTEVPDAMCHEVRGVTMQYLVDLFGHQSISMLKMDCEGCEVVGLPALGKLDPKGGVRVRRLAGELHTPTSEVEDVACRYDWGSYLTKICFRPDTGFKSGITLVCSGSDTKPPAREKCFLGDTAAKPEGGLAEKAELGPALFLQNALGSQEDRYNYLKHLRYLNF